jgi:hypothetical protein
MNKIPIILPFVFSNPVELNPVNLPKVLNRIIVKEQPLVLEIPELAN